MFFKMTDNFLLNYTTIFSEANLVKLILTVYSNKTDILMNFIIE